MDDHVRPVATYYPESFRVNYTLKVVIHIRLVRWIINKNYIKPPSLPKITEEKLSAKAGYKER